MKKQAKMPSKEINFFPKRVQISHRKQSISNSFSASQLVLFFLLNNNFVVF